MNVAFRLLGPVEASVGGDAAQLAERQRTLLALLLLREGGVVSADALVEELWSGRPPRTAVNTLQAHVSQLRRALGPVADRLETKAPGYLLRADAGEVDLRILERLAAEGHAALARNDPEAGAAALRAAVDLERGTPLADVSDTPLLAAERERIRELTLAVREDLAAAELGLGRHAEVVPELERLSAEHPLRERLAGALMLALYRSGRQAEALDVYRRTRALLVDELGLDPSEELVELERAILRHDPALAAPAARRPQARPLPAPAGSFVGRESELARARAAASPGRVLTLTGPGGIGKTQLAVELARRLETDLGAPSVFVDLAPLTDSALVGSAVASALALGDDAETAIGEELAREPRVLVLDNFEQVIGAAPLAARLLASSPESVLLATSREPLRLDAETELPVPPLAADDAVELFVQRARALDPDFVLEAAGRETVEELCRRLDGLPLAIELAAARSRALEPAELLERLGRRLDLPGLRDAPDRHKTLRATMDWSYDLLDGPERRALAHAGVFAGGFDVGAFEAVVGGEDAVDLLASLVDKSLIVRDRIARGRYTLLETVRAYAWERLVESGETAKAAAAHAEHFLRLCEEAEPALRTAEQGRWLDRISADLDNFRAAHAYFLDAEPERALRLAVGLRRYWEARGPLADARQAVGAALAAAPEAPPLLRAKALNTAGVLAGEQGDLGAAREAFTAVVELARAEGDDDWLAASVSNLGNIALFQGDYEQALAQYEESAALARKAGQPERIAVAAENIGIVELAAGDAKRAAELLADAVALARESGDVHRVASALRSQTRALVAAGEVGTAEGVLAEAIALTRELGEPQGLAECLEALAAIAAATGDPGRAATLFGAADALRESIGAQRAPDQGEWSEATMARVQADLDEAEFARRYVEGRDLTPDDVLVS